MLLHGRLKDDLELFSKLEVEIALCGESCSTYSLSCTIVFSVNKTSESCVDFSTSSTMFFVNKACNKLKCKSVKSIYLFMVIVEKAKFWHKHLSYPSRKILSLTLNHYKDYSS